MMERLSNVWLTAVQFFKPFGFPGKGNGKKLIRLFARMLSVLYSFPEGGKEPVL
jgi:hypothetical protein